MQSIESKMGNENEQWEIMIGQEVYQADSETIKQWIAEGRLLADDKIKKANLNWIEVKRVPTFRNLLPTTNPNPNPNILTQPTPQPSDTLNNQSFSNQLSQNSNVVAQSPIADLASYSPNPNQEPLANYVSEIRTNKI